MFNNDKELLKRQAFTMDHKQILHFQEFSRRFPFSRSVFPGVNAVTGVSRSFQEFPGVVATLLLNKLRDETKRDIILQDLYKTIQEGWCQNKKQVKQSVQLYFKYRHALNIYKGVILKDCRIVVPFSMRKDM